MPEEEHWENWKNWMIDVAIDNAGPMGKEMFSQILKKYFKRDEDTLDTLFTNAINEICARVEEIISDAFLKQYLSDCKFLSDQFVVYSNSSSDSVLEAIQLRSSLLVNRFEDFGFKGIGGFFIAANMHLLSLRALGNKENIKFFCEKYIDVGERFNKELDSKAQSFDGVCQRVEHPWRHFDDEVYHRDARRYIELTGERPLDDRNYPTIFYVYTPNILGRQKFFSSPTAFAIDNERVEYLQRSCDETKETIYQNKVKPILDIVGKNSELLDTWKSWVFE